MPRKTLDLAAPERQAQCYLCKKTKGTKPLGRNGADVCLSCFNATPELRRAFDRENKRQYPFRFSCKACKPEIVEAKWCDWDGVLGIAGDMFCNKHKPVGAITVNEADLRRRGVRYDGGIDAP